MHTFLETTSEAKGSEKWMETDRRMGVKKSKKDNNNKKKSKLELTNL